MPRWLLVAAVLAAGCSRAPAPGAGEAATTHLLVSGAVDLTGEAGAVAGADPEGLFREVRFLVRRAGFAVAAAAPERAWESLAAAGFDAVGCRAPPPPSGSPIEATASEDIPAVRVLCASAQRGGPGVGTGTSLIGPLLRAGPEATIALVDGPAGAARSLARSLARRGADVAAVLPGDQPEVEVITPLLGRTAVVVRGIGSLLSADRHRGGALAEVLLDAAGVRAYRLGRTAHPDLRVHFTGWDLPTGDAVLLDGDWWALARPVRPAPIRVPPDHAGFTHGDLSAAALGDVTGDGMPDLAVSYRHPFRPGALTDLWPGAVGVDALGRSAHLGIFDLQWRALWAAGRIPRPIGALAACDGAVALAYTGLDDPQVVATGAAVWDGFGLRSMPDLPGGGTPGCADVDRDGRLDPVILGR